MKLWLVLEVNSEGSVAPGGRLIEAATAQAAINIFGAEGIAIELTAGTVVLKPA